ncbi:hypothetical protein EK21DRAFT_45202, partial [Setomelanomma holmii]
FLHRFVRKLLTEPERDYFWSRFGPQESIRSRLGDASQFLAGRYVARLFAAKEAMRKACDHFEPSSRGFQGLMVLTRGILDSYGPDHRRDGSQSAAPQGLILDALHVSHDDDQHREYQSTIREMAGGPTNSNALDGQLCPISISHDGDFATAIAIVPHIRE